MQQTQTTPRIGKNVAVMSRELPESWTRAIGMLKGKNVDSLKYQKTIRKAWTVRARKTQRLVGI